MRARKDARAEGRNSKLLKMSTSFGKLLESEFSCFAKFSRMPSSFGKLLEMLCTLHACVMCAPSISTYGALGKLNVGVCALRIRTGTRSDAGMQLAATIARLMKGVITQHQIDLFIDHLYS
jgi:hypothetical protein